MPARVPVITRYSKNARTAATRRFTVDAAALRCRSATTFPLSAGPGRAVAAGTLPVHPREHVRRRHLSQAEALVSEEPGEVHHVERIGPDRGRTERPRPKVRQEHVRRTATIPVAADPVLAVDQLNLNRHRLSHLFATSDAMDWLITPANDLGSTPR